MALQIHAPLDVFGADCVTYGDNPMALDNTTVCNRLGEIQSGGAWATLALVIVLVPPTFIAGAAGAWRVKRRSR